MLTDDGVRNPLHTILGLIWVPSPLELEDPASTRTLRHYNLKNAPAIINTRPWVGQKSQIQNPLEWCYEGVGA